MDKQQAVEVNIEMEPLVIEHHSFKHPDGKDFWCFGKVKNGRYVDFCARFDEADLIDASEIEPSVADDIYGRDEITLRGKRYSISGHYSHFGELDRYWLEPFTSSQEQDVPEFECVLCHETIEGEFGCNLEPLASIDAGSCCHACNAKVLQARLAEFV